MALTGQCLMGTLPTSNTNVDISSRLPDELLAETFRLAARAMEQRRLRFLFPAIPLQVCRRWSRVALASPRLWDMIYINEILPSLSDHIVARISRSGTVPLDIRLHLDCEPDISRTLTALAYTSARWREVNIHCRSAMISPDLLISFDQFELPLLETLEVHFEHQPQTHWERCAPYAINSCRPRNLVLINCTLEWGGSILTDLRSLLLEEWQLDRGDVHLFTVPGRGFLDILQQATALERLEIRGTRRSMPASCDDLTELAQSIPLPNLRAIVLSCLWSYEVSHLINTIDAPDVSELTLEKVSFDIQHGLDAAYNVPSLWPAAFRFPHLSKISLVSTKAPKRSIVQLLQAFPKLKELELHGWNSEIARDVLDPRLAPVLRNLDTLKVESLSLGYLVHAVRSGYLGNLRRLSVHLNDASLDVSSSKEEFDALEKDWATLNEAIGDVEVFNNLLSGEERFGTWEEKENWENHINSSSVTSS